MMPKTTTKPPTKKIAIIGAGNIGLALAHLFSRNGLHVSIGSRSLKTHETIAVLPIKEAVSQADISLLTVSDSAIKEVCDTNSTYFKANSTVLHCSGALDSTVLTSASEQGCNTGSAHPLNTFPNQTASLKLLSNNNHNTALYSEGNESALYDISLIFEHVGFRYIEISKQAKPLYHTACVFACNYLTALMDMSLQTARSAKLDEQIFWQALQPLIQSTLNNIGQHGTTASLSGPIARGDHQTVNKHLNELKQTNPTLVQHYADIGLHALTLAVKQGELDDEKINALRSLLEPKV